MMCYKVSKGLEGGARDGEGVVLTLPDGKLLLEIEEREEFV